MIRFLTRIVLFAGLSVALCAPSNAALLQGRDHLTEQEVDLIKDAQILDKRIEVFIKAAERRMMVINNSGEANAKQLKKDAEKWGELPVGTRAQLMSDISRILDEAITNIDDVSARDENNPLIPKALRKLSASASSILTQLKPLADQMKDDSETSTFDQLTENAESIIQAAAKLPAAAEKKSKSKTEKATN
ncbi:MAG TPA: hypothetical protein VJU86_00145 [Pyrinomonadaceae bacterium]|nr:hypothetical protein [Pyrinomonadaceae bacterium]